MRFRSKYGAFRVDLQGQEPILHPSSGQIVGFKKELVAEFAIMGPEFIPRDANGDPITYDVDGSPFSTANMRGHFWDSEQAQRSNNWTDEEREQMEQRVLMECNRNPEAVWVLEDPVVTAPWPSYDKQTDKNVVAFAIEGGLVHEALAYARQEERAKVVSELEAYLAEQQSATEAEQALTAV